MQLQTLRQYILLGFASILAPLLILLWQNQHTLSKMAKQAHKEPRYAVSLMGNINLLESLIVDAERVSRQYQVLNTQTLKDLSRNYLTRYAETWHQLCKELVENIDCRKRAENIDALYKVALENTEQQRQALQLVKQDLKQQSLSISLHLTQRLTAQQQRINQLQSRQWIVSLVLISMSLIIAFYASQRILGPVNKLERMIHQLAGKQHQLDAVSRDGPKELVALQHKLHQLAKRLKQLEQLRKALLRHAAHELKTPLASIKEGCSLLIEEAVGTLNTSQQEVVQLLNTSSMRMETLVEQLLDYNLLLQHTGAERSKIDVVAFVKQFEEEHQLILKDHLFSKQIEAKDVLTDPILLRRILDNLLSNAIAHGTPGGQLTLRTLKIDTDWILEFANQGEEVDLANQGSYFQPFNKSNHQRNDRVSGAGLGLSIVAECATLINAKAEFINVDYADVCLRLSIMDGIA